MFVRDNIAGQHIPIVVTDVGVVSCTSAVGVGGSTAAGGTGLITSQSGTPLNSNNRPPYLAAWKIIKY